jgi:hypothetical protein
MNILKLQDELKSVPDNALVGYVQNPTGHVPSYLALSELQRRKDMREKYQQAQPEKTTVAEDLEQQAQPQPQGIAAIQQPAAAPVVEPGVAGLPVPDQMFSGQGMAAGGIVAFDDGGDVAASDAVPSDVAPGSDLPPDFYMSDIQRSLMGRSPVHYTGATAGPSPAPSSPYGTDMIGEMMRASPEALRYSYGVGRGTSPYAGAAYTSMRKEMGSPGYADGGEVKGFAGPDGSYVNPGLIGGPTQESLPWYSGVNEFLNRNFDWSATNRAAREKGIGDEVTNPFISGMPRTDIMQEYLDIRKRVNTG